MVFVVTIDQKRSRRGQAGAEAFAKRLNQALAGGLALAFEVTVGDELQGVLDSPRALVEAARLGVTDGRWWMGVGLGDVQLAASARRSSGPGFVHAREAVERAKRLPWALAVTGSSEEARALERAFALWLTILQDRSEKGWETVALRRSGKQEREIAQELGITQQAVNQRLRAAHYLAEEEGEALLVRLAEQALEAGG
jgi:hypothetical protein